MDREKTTGIRCRICNKPVGLTFDTTVDEDGKAVHELCYVRESLIKTAATGSRFITMLSPSWTHHYCCKKLKQPKKQSLID